jgi:replicative DNA helicase
MSADVEFDQIPPRSIQAEQSVLGGLFLDNRAWEEIADVIHDIDFYRRDHRLIFIACRELIEQGDPCDVITVSERLGSHGQLEEVGGLAYLVSLSSDTPSAANILSYARIVRENSILRQLRETAIEIQNSTMNTEGRNTDELIATAQKQIMEIGECNQGHEPASMRDELRSAMDRLEERMATGSALLGLDTGYSRLNDLTSGLQAGQLIILAGRPSMGKSALAHNIAERVMQTIPFLMFSLEMPKGQLTDRMIAATARVPFKHYQAGRIDEDELKRVTDATVKLAPCQRYVDDRSALSITEVSATARRFKRRHGLGLVVVDYIQLMKGTGENRTQEVSSISGGLKALAKDLAVPVLALSQLNRTLVNRPNKRPVMSDLRDSGSIEQDADVILFLYRDEVYDEDSPHRGIAELNVAKNRNGETGRIYLTFLNQFVRFENYSGTTPEALPPMQGKYKGFDAKSYQA